MCLKSGAVCLRPPIVRDESSRVFLGGALQQSPPLRRPSSMVGQFSVEVNRKDEPGLCRGRLLLSSKPVKMRAFYSGTDNQWHQLVLPQRRWPEPHEDGARSPDPVTTRALHANAGAVRDRRRARRLTGEVPAPTPEPESNAFGSRPREDGRVAQERARRLLSAAASTCLLPLGSGNSSRASWRGIRPG